MSRTPQVWHESVNGGARAFLGDGRWCLERVELENRILGHRYVFNNAGNRDGWLKPGKRHGVVLKPSVERVDESEDLRLVQQELQVGAGGGGQGEGVGEVWEKLCAPCVNEWGVAMCTSGN